MRVTVSGVGSNEWKELLKKNVGVSIFFHTNTFSIYNVFWLYNDNQHKIIDIIVDYSYRNKFVAISDNSSLPWTNGRSQSVTFCGGARG